MSAQSWTAARHVWRTAIFHACLLRTIGIVAATTLASACSTDPPGPFVSRDPSDPRVRVPATTYRSTVAPYESLRPVEPAPWLQQNQQIAPQPKR
jgi:hypothetical protein